MIKPPAHVGLVPDSDGPGRDAGGQCVGLSGAVASAFGTGSGYTRRRVHLPDRRSGERGHEPATALGKAGDRNLAKKVTAQVTEGYSTTG